MRRAFRSVVALTLLAVASARGGAQTRQPFALQVSGLGVVPAGDAFSDTKPGLGFEAQIRRNWSPVSLGLGLQLSGHEVTGAADPLSLRGVFVEPRYVIPLDAESAAPYVSARLAVFQQRLETEGTTGSATGTQFNVGGGLLLSLTSSVNLDLGATIGMLRFGAYQVRYSGGGGFDVPPQSGTNVVLRAGLAIGVGRTP